MKGVYVLLIKLSENKKIHVGKKGIKNFRKGIYVYVGSGLNNLEKRISRHLKNPGFKKTHWHIDYLLKHSKITHVFYKETMKREECEIAGEIGKKLSSIPEFGCSDCSCSSHLFYTSNEEKVKKILTDKLKMTRYPSNR